MIPEDILNQLLGYLGEFGFGSAVPTGKGQLKFELQAESLENLHAVDKPTHYLNLSMYSSNKGEELKGNYKLKTKFGKVWGPMAEGKLFKRPFLVFEPGSSILISKIKAEKKNRSKQKMNALHERKNCRFFLNTSYLHSFLSTSGQLHLPLQLFLHSQAITPPYMSG